jgi:hypothetical protein
MGDEVVNSDLMEIATARTWLCKILEPRNKRGICYQLVTSRDGIGESRNSAS